MDKKWKCPECGTENGEKDFRDGKFICWSCGHTFTEKPEQSREPFTPTPGETPSKKTPEPFPAPESDKTPTPKPPEPFPGPEPEPIPIPPRTGCMVWMAGLVGVLVLLGVAIYFMKPYIRVFPWIDNGNSGGTVEVTPGTQAGTLRYVDGVDVSLYAPLDGYKPESMARMGNVVYFTQDGALYCLKNGAVSQIDLGGWEAEKVRVWEDEEVLVLTRPREEDSAYRYTILRVYEDSYAEDDLLSDHFIAGFGDAGENFDMYPTDFAVSPSGGNLWLVTRRLKDGAPEDTEYTLDCCTYKAYSGYYDLDTLETKAVFEFMVPDTNTPYMLFDGDGNLYITGPEDGFIRVLRKDERVLETFAGLEKDVPNESDAITGERRWNDFGAVTFLYPTALADDGQYLYVLDAGAVRRIPLDGVPADGIDTLAGNITDNAQAVSAGATVGGADALLSTGTGSELLALDDALLLSSPESGVVYTISTKEG